jgi:hypothetical protein
MAWADRTVGARGIAPAISPVRDAEAVLTVGAITQRARPYTSVEEVERDRGPLRALDRRIVSLYLDLGLSSRECGRRLHLSPSAVLRRLDALGVARRPPGGSRGRLSDRELRRAAFLYERLGLSLSAVAEVEGLRPNAVRHRLLAAGVPLRRPGWPGRGG